jgi:hypothetical protein
MVRPERSLTRSSSRSVSRPPRVRKISCSWSVISFLALPSLDETYSSEVLWSASVREMALSGFEGSAENEQGGEQSGEGDMKRAGKRNEPLARGLEALVLSPMTTT